MSFPNTSFLRRSLALTVVLSASFAVGHAQTSKTAIELDSSTQPAPSLDLQLPLSATSSSSISSSADTEAVADNSERLNFVDAMQYGGRPRYGRPRYRGGNTNADGSSKYMFYGAAGFTQSVGDTWHLFTPSYGIEVGGGRQFNKHFALPIEFDYDNFGLTKNTLDSQFALYNNQINYFCNEPANAATCEQDGITDYSTLDGNAHVWSFSVDPTFTFYQGKGVGAYVVGGAGFYHKVTNFTTPEVEEYYSYYGPEEYEANAVVDHYTSNAPGFSGGVGLTYKISRFSNQSLFAEARYVVVLNSQRQGVTVDSPVNDTTVSESDDFPQNSNRTTYFPIKFGIRF